MRRLSLGTGLALQLLLLPAVHAQQFPEPRRVQGPLAERPDNDTGTAVTLETGISTRVTIPERQFVPCQATVELAYYQRNTLARVEVDISHPSCPAGSGNLEIVASVRDDAGATASLVFPESWTLDDAGRLVFSRDYPIGDNVELGRVRSRRLNCDCVTAGE